MSTRPNITKETISLQVDGAAIHLSVMHKSGDGIPIVLLHGFGSTKEDYADLAFHPRFEGRAILAYDAPGCGESEIDDHSILGIPFFVNTAKSLLKHCQIDRFHLSGHSMGGLTGLLLATEWGNQVASFTNIEGNVAPEDCFLSRQILTFPSDAPQEFLNAFVERAWHAPAFSNALYAASLAHKVRAECVGPIFRSMVSLSDSGDLMDRFLSLPCPKMFVHGDQNRTLSYLGKLQNSGVQLAEIENCGHFPMYSNPAALWARVSEFITQSEYNR